MKTTLIQTGHNLKRLFEDNKIDKEAFDILNERNKQVLSLIDTWLSILDEFDEILKGCKKASDEVGLGSKSMARYVGQVEGVNACINRVKEYLPKINNQ